MLLAIDSGNTNTLFAIHDGKDWAIEWRIATNATRTADEYAVWLHQLLTMQGLSFDDIKDCVISTVVPQSLFNLRNLSRRHLGVEPIIIGEEGVDVVGLIKHEGPKVFWIRQLGWLGGPQRGPRGQYIHYYHPSVADQVLMETYRRAMGFCQT